MTVFGLRLGRFFKSIDSSFSPATGALNANSPRASDFAPLTPLPTFAVKAMLAAGESLPHRSKMALTLCDDAGWPALDEPALGWGAGATLVGDGAIIGGGVITGAGATIGRGGGLGDITP